MDETKATATQSSDPKPAGTDDGAGEGTALAGQPTEALQLQPVTADEIEDLREEAARAKEHWEKLLRATADFENFKKRVARERQEAAKYACEPLLLKLIPVLDNFEAALAAPASADGAALASFRAGVTMIQQQLQSALAEAGLEAIEAAGQPFDPRWHEAVAQQESNDVPEGQVLQQLRKGYKLRDRLLRPAGVVVASKPAGPRGG